MLLGAWSVRWMGLWLRRRGAGFPGILLAGLVLAWPLQQALLQDLRQSRPSTRVLAREWILKNIPEGERIAEEWYTAPLEGCGYSVDVRFSLAEEKKVEHYRQRGFRYLLTSSEANTRFLDAPQRYPEQVFFYEELTRSGRLLQVFSPAITQGGATIKVYELGPVKPKFQSGGDGQ